MTPPLCPDCDHPIFIHDSKGCAEIVGFTASGEKQFCICTWRNMAYGDVSVERV